MEINYWEITFIDLNGVQKTEKFTSEAEQNVRVESLIYDLKLPIIHSASGSI